MNQALSPNAVPSANDVPSPNAASSPNVASSANGVPSPSTALDRRVRFYDARAWLYDFVVGSRLYHHLAWGMHPKEHEAFALASLEATPMGPVLDGGCGSLLFTARCYRNAKVPLTLLDASAGMLARGRRRLEKHGPCASPVAWVQGDLCALPFASATFCAAFHFGVLHCLEQPESALAELARVLRPGGQLFVSVLVLSQRRGDSLLWRLHRSGHIARPKTTEDIDHLLQGAKLRQESSWQRGSFYFVQARRADEE